MKDRPEGDRPAGMEPGAPRHGDGQPKPKRIHLVLGWIVAGVFAVLLAKNLLEHLS